MNFLPLLEAKRDGRVFQPAEIQEFVAAYTAGQIPDYQAAAFLMAIFFRGLTSDETTALTLAMRDSGDQLRFPPGDRPVVDKHSTGGVGDKVSLPLAPLLACLGFRVPMISGRGLGITGGTLDKLDSIPGFQTTLSTDRIAQVVEETGCVIVGQTERMVPADKKLYALRDTTATVPSIPLIVASILSKKLAEGLQALVLDVKFGEAAFMRDLPRARELASAMVRLGNDCGMATRALLTSMDTPLGRAAGNWLEVRESVQCLEGRGPEDLTRLVVECAAHLLVQTRKAAGLEAACQTAAACLASGRPREKWDALLSAQGADLVAFQKKLRRDSVAPAVVELRAEAAGFVCAGGARLIGEVVRDLGGGRLTRDSRIDHHVGLDQIAKPGMRVERGAVLARVHARSEPEARAALERLRPALQIAGAAPVAAPLVVEVIG